MNNYKEFLSLTQSGPEWAMIDLPEWDRATISTFFDLCERYPQIKRRLDVDDLRFRMWGSLSLGHDRFGGDRKSFALALGPYMCHPLISATNLPVEKLVVGANSVFERLQRPILTETFAYQQMDNPRNFLWVNSPVMHWLNEQSFVASLNTKRRYKWKQATARLIETQSTIDPKPLLEPKVKEWLSHRWDDESTVTFSLMQYLWGYAAHMNNLGTMLHVFANGELDYVVSLTQSYPIGSVSPIPTWTLQGIYNRPKPTLTSQEALASALLYLSETDREFILDPTFATSPDDSQLLVYKRVFVNENNERPMLAVFKDTAEAAKFGIGKPYYTWGDATWHPSDEQEVLLQEWKV